MGNRGKPEVSEFAGRLLSALERLIDPRPERWLVAFSGGLDSTVLLHALRAADTETPVVAIHVDHGLHVDSGDWSAHCARVAAECGVEFVLAQVDVPCGPGQSLEAAARDARYRALGAELKADDVLLTAHHADDQLETVLLRLMRGTGVHGLTAVHPLARLGKGRLARPLLEFERADLRAEAHALGLRWLEDPSNADDRFDRNFLRRHCVPQLLERWPQAGLLANRMAGHMLEAEQLLDEVAAGDLADCDDLERIGVERLRGLSSARRDNALRYAIRALGLPVPTAVQLTELGQALSARADAAPRVAWPGAEARVYRQHLYLGVPMQLRGSEARELAVGTTAMLGQGELRLVAAPGYGVPDRWAREGLSIRYRAGGERFRPHASRHHTSLKHWFQDAGIVPWMRQHVPLLYHGDRLVAVADLCLADDLPQSAADAPFWHPAWTGHERLR